MEHGRWSWCMFMFIQLSCGFFHWRFIFHLDHICLSICPFLTSVLYTSCTKVQVYRSYMAIDIFSDDLHCCFSREDLCRGQAVLPHEGLSWPYPHLLSFAKEASLNLRRMCLWVPRHTFSGSLRGETWLLIKKKVLEVIGWQNYVLKCAMNCKDFSRSFIENSL